MITPKELVAAIHAEHKAVRVLRREQLDNREDNPKKVLELEDRISKHLAQIATLYVDLQIADDTDRQIYVNAVQRIVN